MRSSYLLTATIYESDVDEADTILVTVYDPTAVPSETAPLVFHVVESLWRAYMPLAGFGNAGGTP